MKETLNGPTLVVFLPVWGSGMGLGTFAVLDSFGNLAAFFVQNLSIIKSESIIEPLIT